MVQDTSAGSEMYLYETRSGSLGGWGLHEEIDEDAQHDLDLGHLRECNILWAVSVPGEAQWCSEELDGQVDCE